MVIKLASKADKELVSEFCKEHDFFFPTTNSLYTAWSENKLVGLAGLEITIKMEPFIADSPIAARRLYDFLISILKEQDIHRIECFTTNTRLNKVRPLFEKLGFKFVEKTNRFIKEL